MNTLFHIKENAPKNQSQRFFGAFSISLSGYNNSLVRSSTKALSLQTPRFFQDCVEEVLRKGTASRRRDSRHSLLRSLRD